MTIARRNLWPSLKPGLMQMNSYSPSRRPNVMIEKRQYRYMMRTHLTLMLMLMLQRQRPRRTPSLVALRQQRHATHSTRPFQVFPAQSGSRAPCSHHLSVPNNVLGRRHRHRHRASIPKITRSMRRTRTHACRSWSKIRSRTRKIQRVTAITQRRATTSLSHSVSPLRRSATTFLRPYQAADSVHERRSTCRQLRDQHLVKSSHRHQPPMHFPLTR